MSIPFARIVRSLLVADSAVQAALPGGIHPDQIPQESELPAAAWQVSSEPFQSLSSASGLSRIGYATLTLTGIARTSTQSEAIDKAVRAVIEANRARIIQGASEIHRLQYSGIQFDNEFLADGDDESYRRVQMTITGFCR
jgi:hypothetical protein